MLFSAINPQQQISIFGKGAGILNFDLAMNPSLVYDCSVHDYVKFLLGQGVKENLAQMYGYHGPELEKIKPYELNYPSITVEVPKGQLKYDRSIPRQLTCVGSFGNYKVEVKDITAGIDIKIEPTQLDFDLENNVQSFSVKVTVDRKIWKDDLFVTYLVWKKEHHTVTSPVVIVLDLSPKRKRES